MKCSVSSAESYSLTLAIRLLKLRVGEREYSIILCENSQSFGIMQIFSINLSVIRIMEREGCSDCFDEITVCQHGLIMEMKFG